MILDRSVVIRRNRKGRGLYALRDFQAEEVIEVSPMLLIPEREVRSKDKLAYYCFVWDEEHYGLALGLGSLFNHSSRANAYYEQDIRASVTRFMACRLIQKGREITINYNGVPNDPTPAHLYPGPKKK